MLLIPSLSWGDMFQCIHNGDVGYKQSEFDKVDYFEIKKDSIVWYKGLSFLPSDSLELPLREEGKILNLYYLPSKIINEDPLEEQPERAIVFDKWGLRLGMTYEFTSSWSYECKPIEQKIK